MTCWGQPTVTVPTGSPLGASRYSIVLTNPGNNHQSSSVLGCNQKLVTACAAAAAALLCCKPSYSSLELPQPLFCCCQCRCLALQLLLRASLLLLCCR